MSEAMHTPAECPLNRHLHASNRGKVPLCQHCLGHDPVADACRGYADALIEIAAAFYVGPEPVADQTFCVHCDTSMFEVSCLDYCAGLSARRLLGVA